jgi:hypothetical protein
MSQNRYNLFLSNPIGEKGMNPGKVLTSVLFTAVLIACNSNPQPAAPSSSSGGTTLAPASATPANDQDNSKVCALFTAADAQKIMGVPMQLKPGHGARVCLYEEVTQRPGSAATATVALTLNRHETAQQADIAWKQLKEVRHLEPGQKNVQVLSGIGEEAYFTGNISKGKVGVGGVIVRKGNANFAIDTMSLDYIASPDAMKAEAKRIADQV